MGDQGVAVKAERPSTQTSRGQDPTPASPPRVSKRVTPYCRVSAEDQAKLVREIFRLARDERRFTQAIAEALNAQGIVTERGRSWSKRGVFRVLHSPLYIGSRRWEDITLNAHEAIVDPARVRPRRRRTRRRDD